MQYIRAVSLILLLAIIGFGVVKTSAMQKKLDALQQHLLEKHAADQETTRRTEDVERDFRLIRDKLNI